MPFCWKYLRIRGLVRKSLIIDDFLPKANVNGAAFAHSQDVVYAESPLPTVLSAGRWAQRGAEVTENMFALY